jgi:hypothetical protein
MRKWLLAALLVSGLAGQVSCFRYVPLGTTPPENPDYSPPIEARITLLKPVPLPADCRRGSGDVVSGQIVEWKEESILLHVDDCFTDPKCTVEIPVESVGGVEARSSTFSSGMQSDLSVEAIVVLAASGAALAFVGYMCYDAAEHYDSWLMHLLH